MSLDVYLVVPEARPAQPRQAIFVRRDGATVEITRSEWDALRPGVEPVTVTLGVAADVETVAYSVNITHNLGRMAAESGVYEPVWHPEECGIETAAQLIAPLEAGIALLQSDPDRFTPFNPDNGWGRYEGLLQFLGRYLAACRSYPEAKVSACR